MKNLPPSTHAVARIVPKNPNWALESTIAFTPSQLRPSSICSSNREHRPATADDRREQKETD